MGQVHIYSFLCLYPVHFNLLLFTFLWALAYALFAFVIRGLNDVVRGNLVRLDNLVPFDLTICDLFRLFVIVVFLLLPKEALDLMVGERECLAGNLW